MFFIKILIKCCIANAFISYRSSHFAMIGILSVLIFSSCAVLPHVYQEKQPVKKLFKNDCSLVFAKGDWQFVHSIEAVMKGGYKSSLLGVCNISSSTNSIRCVMMTIEGFVLFDAEFHNDNLTIKRGIAPFDSRAFAMGLMNDIRLIFFKPTGKLLKTGTLENGLPVCRYETKTKIIDIVILSPHSFEIAEYNKNYRLLKKVNIEGQRYKNMDDGFIMPDKIVLKANRQLGYSLYMDIVQAEKKR